MTSRSALIDEVFIKPIRTVMVVDDEFPTLDDFLAIEQALDKKKSGNMRRVQDILAFCRDESRGWLVDIHDGKSNKEGMAVAGHLHHSDLLILDYHLEWPSDSGEKAIGILRELAKSPHFNLVIVYTAADINRTVGEIALGLTCKDAKLDWPLPGAKVVEDALDEWGDKVPDINIRNQLIGALDPQTFLRIRWDEKRNLKIELDRSDLASFKAIASSAEGIGVEVAPSVVLKWCLSKLQQNLAESLSPEDLGKVAVSIDAETNWIRTGGLFVTVVSKTQPTAELPSRLSTALRSWDPLPQRLILSKLQTELDAAGTNAENEILSNRHLQAGWLDDFLNENGQAIPTSITIERHWESLGDAIRPEVMNYSAQLAKSLLDIADIRRHRFEGEAPLDYEREKGDVSLESNIHACSKRVSGSHLAVGHILKIQRSGQDLYWICLTPACDLVPGQKESGWMARLGTWMPFKAVQLFPQKPGNALVDATRGNHLFLRIDGSSQAFGFLPPTSAASNPKWEQMFAKNSGRFEDSDRLLTIADLSAAGNGELAANFTEGQVVAQLRYEYALNLLQRLGANLSRIGLEFQAHEKPQAQN
ncbi:MAG: response regulator receiver domain [Pseudomonadota bacterium]